MTEATTTAEKVAIPSRPENILVGRALALRDNPYQRGARSALAAALIPATESLAFPYTEAVLADVRNPQAKSAARRVAGMVATHKHAVQYQPKADSARKRKQFGESVGFLHYKNFGRRPGAIDSEGAIERNALTMQVDSLPILPMEQAAQVIALLVSRCANEGISVDFFDIAATLTQWGSGISPRSRDVRNRVVESFYGADVEGWSNNTNNDRRKK